MFIANYRFHRIFHEQIFKRNKCVSCFRGCMSRPSNLKRWSKILIKVVASDHFYRHTHIFYFSFFPKHQIFTGIPVSVHLQLTGNAEHQLQSAVLLAQDSVTVLLWRVNLDILWLRVESKRKTHKAPFVQ